MTAFQPRMADVPAEYRPLYRYLDARFADAVVLTFREIEDLIGVPLPEAARRQQEWWTNDAAEGGTAPQSQAWTIANRRATPHLTATSVRFDRVPVRR
jgi:hypothetical protein